MKASLLKGHYVACRETCTVNQNVHREVQLLKSADPPHIRRRRRRGGIPQAAFSHLARAGGGAEAARRPQLLHFFAPW